MFIVMLTHHLCFSNTEIKEIVSNILVIWFFMEFPAQQAGVFLANVIIFIFQFVIHCARHLDSIFLTVLFSMSM